MSMFVRVDDNRDVVYTTLYFDNLKLWMEAAEGLGLMYQVYKLVMKAGEAQRTFPNLYSQVEWMDKTYNDNVLMYTFILETPKP